jgi:hypothetical protein
MDIPMEKRAEVFRWNTRYELYDYFRNDFSLKKKDIDREIYAVIASFKPRRGRIIRTKELWKKVGMNLEEKYTSSLKMDPLD